MINRTKQINKDITILYDSFENIVGYKSTPNRMCLLHLVEGGYKIFFNDLMVGFLIDLNEFVIVKLYNTTFECNECIKMNINGNLMYLYEMMLNDKLKELKTNKL
jgi:hypothetical protein